MASLDEIEKLLADNPSSAEISATITFCEILEILSIGVNPVDRLYTALQALEPLLPIAKSLDHKHIYLWRRWATTIRLVQDILASLSLTPPENRNHKKRSDTWRGQLGTYPLLSCLITRIDDEAPSGLLPAKAILLIRRYARYVEEDLSFSDRSTFSAADEKNLADTIRKCSTLKWKHLAIAQEYLPDWPSTSPTEWEKSFFEKAKRVPRYKDRREPYPGKYDFIHTIRDTLGLVAEKSKDVFDGKDIVDFLNTRLRAATTPPPSPPKNPSVVTKPPHERFSRSGRKISIRPAFDLFQKQPQGIDANIDGLAPDTLHVVPQPDTPSDQPSQLAAVQSLEVRYTNYRTSMDNQRLPWSWDCLNQFEIVALRKAMKAHTNLENTPLPEKQGAFLVWLMLSTGQSVDRILQLDLTHSRNNQGALMPGPIYRRHILSPRHAFRPSEQQKILLSSHVDFVDLQLLPPFPSLISELGLDNSTAALHSRHHNIGAYLNLDEQAADKTVRQFLEQHRTRDIRLLPGRVRNVLGTEIMRVANDPVATHLLTALPTDMPPAGIYYTAYPEDVLQQIYKEAITRIFGEAV